MTDELTPRSLEFWFEFASTYSYPAAMRIEELAQRSGAKVRYRPFLLAPIFQAQGWNNSPFNIYEAKGRYMWRDMERICADLKLEFRKPTVFPRSGLLAARVACEFSETAWVGDFVRAVYSANFALDRDISDADVVRSLLESVGRSDAQQILGLAQSDAAKAKLRAQTDEAQRLGIFGSPMLRVGEELFWGNDRLEEAFEWLGRAS